MKLRMSNFINRAKLNSLIKQCKVFADEDNDLFRIYEDLKDSKPNYLINLLTEEQIRELEKEDILTIIK